MLGARLVHRRVTSEFLKRPLIKTERFIPSLDGLEVTDVLTGLVWRRCLEGMQWSVENQSCIGSPLLMHWKDALRYTRDNQDGGWRIPNIKELVSIIDHSTSSPAMNQVAFPNGSSSTISSTAIHIWEESRVSFASFVNGAVFDRNIYEDQLFAVRLVRRGRK